MTGTPPGGAGERASGFLEFFILEAADYIEQIDSVLLGGSTAGPDGGALQRAARALRGTATMARLPAFAEVAAGLERVGRALHEGSLGWDPGLSGALVAAVDDLKILLRAGRHWGPADEQRAAARTAELARYAGAARPSVPADDAPVAAPSAYLATEAANVAAGLELLTARGDAETSANVLRRIRALRGVAGVKEITPLADTLEATEDAARGMEVGEPLSADARHLLEASSAYLRTIARALRGEGGDVNAPGATRDTFNAALESWLNRTADRAPVVPIDQLFYEDGAAGLVQATTNPPTSSAERLRLELVSLGEHLRQVLDGARAAADTGSSVKARRELRRALREAQAAAESFGESDVARFVDEHVSAAEHLDFLGLAALDDLARTLTDPGVGAGRLKERMRELADRREAALAIAAGFSAEGPGPDPQAPTQRPSQQSPLIVATPVSAPAVAVPSEGLAEPEPVNHWPEARKTATPVHGDALEAHAPAPVQFDAVEAPLPTHESSASSLSASSLIESTLAAIEATSSALIDSSIAALSVLEDSPFAEPTPLPEDALVSIDALLYRGRSALDRAVELRDEIRASGENPSTETLDELFDLLELARAE